MDEISAGVMGVAGDSCPRGRAAHSEQTRGAPRAGCLPRRDGPSYSGRHTDRSTTMVKKMQKASSGDAKKAGPALTGTVKESASQIWLAGLGAFAKAQEEGGKVFEALVREGTSIQRKTQAAAEEKISEATNRMASMATDI